MKNFTLTIYLISSIFSLTTSLNCFASKNTSDTRSNKKSSQIAYTIHSENQRIIVEHLSKFWSEDLGVIWGFDFLSSSNDTQDLPKLIVTERGGKMYFLSLATGHKEPISGLPQMVEVGQGGLMDVRVHPQFAENKLVFFSYVARYENGTGTIVARAKLEGSKLRDIKTLFKSSPPGSSGRHFGCRIVFQGNKIYFAIGDRGDRHKAQDLSYPNGKVYRIYEDGSIPEDNPFIGKELKNKRKALAAIWSYGHRNPQGLAIHPHTGQIWEQEHGPRGGDEINLIQKGKNYGWPVITYGKEYWGPSIGTTHKKGMEQPIKFYVPSIAPSSLMIYSGRLFTGWKGDFFSTALRDPHISRVVIKKSGKTVLKAIKQESILSDFPHRIRHIRETPNGQIIFSTDSGHFYRMRL